MNHKVCPLRLNLSYLYAFPQIHCNSLSFIFWRVLIFLTPTMLTSSGTKAFHLKKKNCYNKNPTQFSYGWNFLSQLNFFHPKQLVDLKKALCGRGGAARGQPGRAAGSSAAGAPGHALALEGRGSGPQAAAGRAGPLPAAPFLVEAASAWGPRMGPAEGRPPGGRGEGKTRAPPAVADPGTGFMGRAAAAQ